MCYSEIHPHVPLPSFITGGANISETHAPPEMEDEPMFEIIHRSLQLALVIINLLVKLVDPKTIASMKAIFHRVRFFGGQR
jgi:hypothetical protein